MGRLCYSVNMDNITQNPAYIEPPIIASQMGGVQDALNFVGEVIVAGVSLPLQVIEQLRQAGIGAVSWLSASELQDAVQACKYDAKLVDDPGGLNFRDKLTLTREEQAARRPKKKKAQSYEEQLKAEREGKSHEHEEDHDPEQAVWECLVPGIDEPAQQRRPRRSGGVAVAPRDPLERRPGGMRRGLSGLVLS